jgi:hypothetical protein
VASAENEPHGDQGAENAEEDEQGGLHRGSITNERDRHKFANDPFPVAGERGGSHRWLWNRRRQPQADCTLHER